MMPEHKQSKCLFSSSCVISVLYMADVLLNSSSLPVFNTSRKGCVYLFYIGVPMIHKFTCSVWLNVLSVFVMAGSGSVHHHYHHRHHHYHHNHNHHHHWGGGDNISSSISRAEVAVIVVVTGPAAAPTVAVVALACFRMLRSDYRKSLPGQFIRIRLKIEQNCRLFLDIFVSAIINDLFMTFPSRLKVDAKCVYQQWNWITVANYFGTPPADWVHGYLYFEPGA